MVKNMEHPVREATASCRESIVLKPYSARILAAFMEVSLVTEYKSIEQSLTNSQKASMAKWLLVR